MNITDVKLYSYEIDLVRPFFVKGSKLERRIGYILELSSHDHVGYGEIAPLEGFSPDTLSEALGQLKLIKPFLMNEPIPAQLPLLQGASLDWLGNLSLCPSVNFGVEMAALNLMANIRSITLKELLSETTHVRIPINGLLQGDKNEVIKEATEMLVQGFTSFKLKVGQSIEDDIELVQELTKLINGRALLNIDANQSWDLKDAILFGNQVGLAAVYYVEEPFNNIDDIPEFFHHTTIPVALDESLLKHSFQDIKSVEGVDFLILKPSVIGGIEKTWAMLREAKRLGIDTLISSVFESAIGLLTLSNLAGCSFRNNPAGLDTAKWFSNSLLNTPLSINRGKIEIGQRSVMQKDVNFNLLQRIDLS